MKILELFSEYNYLIEMVYGALVVLVTFFVKDLRNNVRKYRLNRIFMFSQDKIHLSIPIRHGLLNEKRFSRLESDYVTFDEAMVIHEVSELMGELDDKEYIGPQRGAFLPAYNLICIGGPMVNPIVQEYFRGQLSKVKLKWQHEHDTKRTKEFHDFIYIDNSNEKAGLRIGEKEFQYNTKNEGYVFLARLVGNKGKQQKNDFQDEDHGTVHILFGVNSKATLSAVKSLSIHRNELYKRLKHRKGHYLVVIKCNLDGVLDFNNYMDYTDDVFCD